MKRGLFCVLLFLLIPLLFSCGEDEAEKIIPAKIDVLDIGKADCIIIDTGSNIVMIDTGEGEDLSKIHKYMENNKYEVIDTLILTHYDKDHVGGASEIIKRYGVKTVVESKRTDDTLEYEVYHSAISECGTSLMKLENNYSFTFDSCSFEVDVPKRDRYEKKDDNNSSLVITMRCGEKQFLFLGDAMELRLDEILESHRGEYDFVKLPHHGTYLENYRELFDSIKTGRAAVTSSKKNPAEGETKSLLEELGIELYETRLGAVTVRTDGKNVEVSQ